jgi:lysine-N-methylase
MAPRQTHLLQPQYASAFRCIGPECEDSCCVGWSVFFDQKSRAKYESLPESPLRLKILNNLKPIPNESIPASKLNARLVQMTSANACAFLQADRLCEIQTTLGADALSSTCANFPRIRYTIDQLEEASLTLACPEAARLVLENKSLLSGDAAGHYQFNWDDERTAGEPLHAYFWPIREFSIRLVTNRNYPLWQRLFLLGLFTRRLDQIVVSAQAKSNINFGRMLTEFDAAVNSGLLRSQMVKIPANISLQLKLLVSFINLRTKEHVTSTRMFKLIRQFDASINSSSDRSIDGQVRAFSDACYHYYEPLINAHPQLLENYLVNQIFRTLFPFGADAFLNLSLNDEAHSASARNSTTFLTSKSFLHLATQFALVKGILIGIAGFHRVDFSLHHAVDAIQIISRVFEHHQYFLDESYAMLQAAGQDTPAGFATLLRN